MEFHNEIRQPINRPKLIETESNRLAIFIALECAYMCAHCAAWMCVIIDVIQFTAYACQIDGF